jgi:glycosyltransferase involved in cell wall biosynthesis
VKWLEYSAAGIPGVYSDLDPYAHVVRHDATGLLVEPSLPAWTTAIERLLLDPTLRASIRDAARTEVQASWAIGRAATRWSEALDRAIANRARRPAPPRARNPVVLPFEELIRAA